MTLSLNSNIAALQSQRQLFKTSEELSTVFERLSSGQRINRARDDAAGLAIAESLNTDRRVFNQGLRNLNDGFSILNIGDGTVAELSSIVIRIQELAEQSANGTFSSVQRASLDEEAQTLKDEFLRIAQSSEFNGLRLFDGSIEGGVRLQAGYGIDGSIFSSLGGELGDGTFQFSQTLGEGNIASNFVTGDFDRDGNLDLVTSNPLSDSMLFLKGNGDGSFSAGRTLQIGNISAKLVSGDFNNDGWLDLVSAAPLSDALTVLSGNGDGSFQTISTFNVGNISASVVSGDFDGDGNIDLVSSNPFTDDITLLSGNGDGSFRTTFTFRPNNLASATAVGDFNEDGLLDLVMSSPTTDVMTVLTGNGDGTFSTSSTFRSGNLASRISTGDFDGDGRTDLVTTNPVSDSMTVLRGNGDGTFSTYSTFRSGNIASELVIGDFNNDGLLDLISSNPSSDSMQFLESGSREGINPILDFSLKTQADALQALAPLERKLQSLSEQRGIIGAFQSRLSSALNTLAATSENYAAAESRIRDADMAQEAANLTRLNILQQAASSVLAQANQQPALALQLLEGG